MDYTSQDVAGIEQKRRHVIAEDMAGMNCRCRVIAGMDNRSQVIAGMQYAKATHCELFSGHPTAAISTTQSVGCKR